MKFRPCIDIHNGKVKQIVGGSLSDVGDAAVTNFESEQDAGFYARKYREDGLVGGHIILLNAKSSEYYEATRQQALLALEMYPQGLQIGGGITAENAAEYIEAGASHVIVTSYVFQNGEINFENLESLCEAVGKERIVLDLSCRKRDGEYYIVTDRWQNFTKVKVSVETLGMLAAYCDEFLVHGVDVEGKASGVELELVKLLAKVEGIPITYAGGIGGEADLEAFAKACDERLDFTVGSALDLFGGSLPYDKLLERNRI
ncbi:MAG: phosphoribosylformimino-5-aminoimidazole carboxamide ribotide isomerase [Faecalimonas sp.]|nr:phosphoribosylformimino-5-aminoimidazole carboxamide ribotide isomerase [Faecalimonas sp.]